jgi:hypothetical protein
VAFQLKTSIRRFAMSFLLKSLLCCGVVFPLLALPGLAATITTPADPDSDTLLVFGVSRTITEPAAGEGAAETSITTQVPAGVTIGNFVVELTDSAGISDVIFSTTAGNVSAISLFSDPGNIVGNIPPGYPAPKVIAETGGLQDISAFFNVSAGQIAVQSDGDVPEPGALLLLATGTAVLDVRFLLRKRGN